MCRSSDGDASRLSAAFRRLRHDANPAVGAECTLSRAADPKDPWFHPPNLTAHKKASAA